MPQSVTPASASGAPSIFPANLSGKAMSSANGAANFAELLKGSQNINAVPGGGAAKDAKATVDGANGSGRDRGAATVISDDADGEPGQDETGQTGDGEALLPLAVLSGEADEDAAIKTGLPSTIDQLTPAQTAKSDLAATEAQGDAAPEGVEAEAEIAAAALLGSKGETTPSPAANGRAVDSTDGTPLVPAEGTAVLGTPNAPQPKPGPTSAADQTDPAQQAGKNATAGARPSPDTASPLAPRALDALQSPEPGAADPEKEVAKQLAPGQQITAPAAGNADEAPGPAVAAAARMANDSLGEPGAAVSDPGTQAVKAAVQAALAEAGRGRTGARSSQMNDAAPQAAPTADHVETSDDHTDPAFDITIDDGLKLDTASTDAAFDADALLQPAAAAATAQQAEAQASSGSAQSGVVTVQAGEMRETVATATPYSRAAQTPPGSLQMLDPEWPVNLTSMIRAAQEMGQNEIEIALQPEKLGKMTIKLDMRDSSNVAVNIVTETDAAARMLNDNQSRLADMMQKAGLDLAQHQASSGQAFQDQSGQDGQTGRNADTGADQWQIFPDDEIPAQSVQGSPDKGIDIIA